MRPAPSLLRRSRRDSRKHGAVVDDRRAPARLRSAVQVLPPIADPVAEPAEHRPRPLAPVAGQRLRRQAEQAPPSTVSCFALVSSELRSDAAMARPTRRNSSIHRSIRRSGGERLSSCRKRWRSTSRPRPALHESCRLTSNRRVRSRWAIRSSTAPPPRLVLFRWTICFLFIRQDCGTSGRGAKSCSCSVRYGSGQPTAPFPVFVPEAGEFKLLSMTVPSQLPCRILGNRQENETPQGRIQHGATRPPPNSAVKSIPIPNGTSPRSIRSTRSPLV